MALSLKECDCGAFEGMPHTEDYHFGYREALYVNRIWARHEEDSPHAGWSVRMPVVTDGD